MITRVKIYNQCYIALILLRLLCYRHHQYKWKYEFNTDIMFLSVI